MAPPTCSPSTATNTPLTAPKAMARTTKSLISIQPKSGRLTIATDNARTQELLRWALSASRHDQVPDDPADTECEHEEGPVQDGTGKSATLAGKLSVIALHVASSYSSSLNFKLKVLDFVKSGGLTLTVLPQFVGCTPPQR